MPPAYSLPQRGSRFASTAYASQGRGGKLRREGTSRIGIAKTLYSPHVAMRLTRFAITPSIQQKFIFQTPLVNPPGWGDAMRWTVLSNLIVDSEKWVYAIAHLNKSKLSCNNKFIGIFPILINHFCHLVLPVI
jgi:hypothetical protein